MSNARYQVGYNVPWRAGNELRYIDEAFRNYQLSGDGPFTKKCHDFFEEKYKFRKALLTNSCTDALELAAILLNIGPGDEVIVPSYTFVSTANAFALRGAEIIFADSGKDHPNIDAAEIEKLITKKTRAIVPVHYGGVACDMKKITALAAAHKIDVVEDAAQCIDAFCDDKPLGSFGTVGTFSFHETKNIHCGEGGMLTVNDEALIERAGIIRLKGTNRGAFERGEVDKYTWVDVGSSFAPGEMAAAFLYAQLEKLDVVQSKRMRLWNRYCTQLKPVEQEGKASLPVIPGYAGNNGHLFYLVCATESIRDGLIQWLDKRGVQALFHYQPLHSSPYFLQHHERRSLPNTERFARCIVRLPLFHELEENIADLICEEIISYFKQV